MFRFHFQKTLMCKKQIIIKNNLASTFESVGNGERNLL